MILTLRQRLARRARAALIVLLAVAVALVGAVATMGTAQAAGKGPGYGTWDNSIGWEGAFIAPNGQLAYCIEPGADNPSGSTWDGGYSGSVASLGTSLSATTLARINAVVTTFGQTGDNREATAVGFAVKLLANAPAMYTSHNYSGAWNLRGYSNWVLYSLVGSAEARAVADRAQDIYDWALGVTPAGPSGSGKLVMVVDGLNNYAGTVTMAGTAGSTGSITLTNGRFVSTGTSTLNGAAANVAYAIEGVPPRSGADYKISGTGTFTTGGSGNWAGNIRVFYTSGQQTIAGPGQRTTPTFTVSGQDPGARESGFAPAIGASAPRFLKAGEQPRATAVFTTVDPGTGLNNSWPRFDDGTSLPVVAKGTLYGPFTNEPVEDVLPPDGAPVAGTTTVTSNAGVGATKPYDVTLATPVNTAGYYTWVWTIDYADQDALAQAFIDPNWMFTTDYGLYDSTSVVPMDIRVSTQVTEPTTTPGATIVDTAAVSVNGPWLQRNGQPIPVKVRFDAYQDAGTVTRIPGTTIPARAKLVGSYLTTVTGPGNISTPSSGAGSLVVPAGATGSIVWVASIRQADQVPDSHGQRGYVRDFVDDYGIPAEMSTIYPNMDFSSTTTSVVQKDVKLSGPAADTATVRMPTHWFNLTAGVVPVTVRWDAYYDTAASVSRVPGTAVPSTAKPLGTIKQTITSPATLTTPTTLPAGAIKVPASGKGSIVWAFKVLDADQPAQFRPYIAEFVDDYGIPAETSNILVPTLKSQATPGVVKDAPFIDNAIIGGTLPENGGQLTFDVYKIPTVVDADGAQRPAYPTPAAKASGDLSWVCTPANAVGTDTATGQKVTTPGTYPSFAQPASAHGKYLWVEKLWSIPYAGEPRELIASGTCGVKDETSFALNVSTVAQSDTGTIVNIKRGTKVWDTATLTGYVPEGGKTVFEGYLIPADTPAADIPAMCTPENLTWASPAIVHKGGLYSESSPLKITGASHVFAPEVDSKLLWVHVTTDDIGRVVSKGACGDPNETLGLQGANIYTTGGELAPGIALGAGLVTLLAGGGLVLLLRRRTAK